MSDQNPRSVPYAVFEEVEARNAHTVKRLMGIIIMLIILLFIACGCIGIVAYYYESQYETIQVDMDTEGGGYNNYIGESGIITNGAGE